MHTYLHAGVHTCIHTPTYIYPQNIRTHTHTNIHTHTYKHIHTYIHTTADLKRSSGLLTWKVRDKTNKDNWFSGYEDVPEDQKKNYQPTFWPPPNAAELHCEENASLKIRRMCIYIYIYRERERETERERRA